MHSAVSFFSVAVHEGVWMCITALPKNETFRPSCQDVIERMFTWIQCLFGKASGKSFSFPRPPALIQSSFTFCKNVIARRSQRKNLHYVSIFALHWAEQRSSGICDSASAMYIFAAATLAQRPLIKVRSISPHCWKYAVAPGVWPKIKMSDTEESQLLKESMAEAWAWFFPCGDNCQTALGL